MKSSQTEILLNKENKPEATKIMCFLNELTSEELEKMLVFIQGVMFAKEYEQQKVISKI